MADRKLELQRKREKLEALRQEKERRRREREQEEIATTAENAAVRDIRQEAEDMLESLGLSANSDPSLISSSAVSINLASISSTGDPGSAHLSLASTTSFPGRRNKAVQLSSVVVHQTNILPKEQVVYDKQTQTASAGTVDREAQPRDYYVLVYDEDEENSSSLQTVGDGTSPPLFSSSGVKARATLKQPVGSLPEVEMVKPAEGQVILVDEPSLAERELVIEKKAKEMSEDDKDKILTSGEFQSFLDRTSRIIERALDEDFDILIDYSRNKHEDTEKDDSRSHRLSPNRVFYNDQWCRSRIVTSLDWSTQYPELLVSAYNCSEDNPNEPDGVVLVWNNKFKKDTPEYVFHYQSPVVAATFAKFHPNLIIGGTYSGQIVLWDNRNNKRTPIQRSPLSTTAHTHPVYCLRVVGTQNAHNLVSISTDGRLCSWSLDMLAQPQDILELQHKQSKAVAVTCLSFPGNDVNNFVVGSEDGSVYTGCRHGTKAGITEAYDGHFGPITGLASNNAGGNFDFSHIFVTSSIDWTVKLWSLRDNKPLHSFEDNGDYVYDVAWSPIHPGLFASIDGNGKLDLWSLNLDTETPAASTLIDNGSRALNRVSWTPNGHQVVVGDDSGCIWVFDVGEKLAQPAANEWSKFALTLQEMKSNRLEEESNELGSGSGVAVSHGNVLGNVTNTMRYN